MGGFVVTSYAEIELGEEILSYQPILGWKGLLAMESQNHQIEKFHSNFEYILLNSVCR
jgi:hypothetical protein